MLSVRDIIKEACCRIGLVPRRQPVPGDVVETALNFLKGVVNKYNKDNLLSFTQNSIVLENKSLIHIYDETDYLKGENNLYFDSVAEMNQYDVGQSDVDNNVWAICKDSPTTLFQAVSVGEDSYAWIGRPAKEPYPQRYQEMKRYEQMTHVQIRNLYKINSIYVINLENEPYREICELNFVNHTDYDRYGNETKTFTYTQKSNGEWLIEIKPIIARQKYRLKLNYNEGFTFDLDSDLYIPDNYVELLIVALAHKLALRYPRIDDTQMQRLQNEVSILVDNVKTPNAVDRMILRDDYWTAPKRMTQAELMSGDWIY
jgi:hypothetical protein